MSLWKIILKQSLAWASVAVSGFAFFWVVSNFSQVMGTAPQAPAVAEEAIPVDASSTIPDFPKTEKTVSVGSKATGLTLRDNPVVPKENILKAAASDTATFKELRITGWIDFTDAEIRGLNVTTTVNNFYTTQSHTDSSTSNSGSAVATATAPPPIIVYNSSVTRQTESWQPVVGQIGGVSYDFSVGRNLTIDQNATVGSNLTIASSANSSGNLTVYGSATVSGSMGLSAATLSGSLTANGNVTLGDSSGDTITVNGRLSTLNVSDGSTTSTITRNSLILAQDSSNTLGKFYVDSSGNTSASGTWGLPTTYATSTLPTAGTAGRITRVSNASRGLWMDQGSQWFSLGGGIFDVKEFGAKGNGTTDDSTALTNAMTAAIASGGGIILFPPGTYYISGQFTWPVTGSNITLMGSGQGVSTLVLDAGGSPADSYGFLISGTYGTSCTAEINNIGFKHMTIRGIANDTTAAAFLIQINYCTNDVLVEDVEFKWARGSGVRVTANGNALGRRLTIDKSYFHQICTAQMAQCQTGHVYGGSNETRITNNIFEEGGYDQYSHAVYIGGNGAENMIISNNTFRGAFETISTYTAGKFNEGITITGNTFEFVSIPNPFWGMHAGVVSGNSFYSSAASIGVGSDYMLFEGNNFYATSTVNQGTLLTVGYGVKDAQVTNNIFTVATSSFENMIGVWLSTSQNITVAENQFYGPFYSIRLTDTGTNHVIKNNRIYNSSIAAAISLAQASNSGSHLVKDNYIMSSSTAAINDDYNISSNVYLGNTITGGGSLPSGSLFNNNYVTANLAGQVVIGNANVTSTARLTVNFGGIEIGGGTATTTVTSTYFILNRTASNALGSFYIDSSGNASASGTLRVYGGASTGGLLISSTNTTTTLTSYVSGNGVGAFVLDTNTLFSPASSTVLLSVRNGGNKVFSISNDGYVASTGTFNANVASTGIGDVAEYVNLTPGESAEPGDVLIVDSLSPNKYKKSGIAYARTVAGAVSDTGAFIIGASGYGRVPLALAGLVKIKVTNEAGSIQAGDYLVTASKSGYAMKYNFDDSQPAGLVGMALESLTDAEGKITVLISKGLVSGAGTSLTVSANNSGQLTQNGPLDLNGQSIVNISYIKAKNDTWQIDENGNLVSRLKTARGDKEVYNLASNEKENLVLSGAARLESGQKQIIFDELDKEIISQSVPLKIFITSAVEGVELFVSERSFAGFTVKEKNSGVSNTAFDWLVIARRKTQSEINGVGGDNTNDAVTSTNDTNTIIVVPTESASSTAITTSTEDLVAD